MALRSKNVVLCRALSEKSDNQEAYVKTLKSAGYACHFLRTLQFEFLNTQELRACLLTPDKYLGLILTSRRAVEAIGLASKDSNLMQPWKGLSAYCVGPATESFAKSHLGLVNCLGSEAGNANELAKKIVHVVGQNSKPLLYPCSDIARETIQEILKDNEINVKKMVTYRTLPSEFLERDLLELMDSAPRIFVFFSPSSVEHIVNLLKKKLYDTNNMKVVAIGPVTKQALEEGGFKVFATANKPDPAALLEAIIDADKETIM